VVELLALHEDIENPDVVTSPDAAAFFRHHLPAIGPRGGLTSGVLDPGRATAERPVSSLADDFFCLTLDERSGTSRLASRVTGVGLSSAILAELVVGGYVTVESGEMRALRVQPPSDRLAGDLHGLMLSKPHHRDPTIWIGFLARDAFVEIGNRLARKGVVTPVRRRRLAGVRTVFEPVDHSTIAWPAIRIARNLTDSDRITLEDLTCAGLAVATGLINRLLWDPVQHASARLTLPAALTRLPPPVVELLAHTETAVGEAILSGRH
jgi:hypothetical protein